MLNTQAFLYHARDYLNATVSAETLRQAEVAQTDSEKTRIDVSATTATHRKTINLLRTDIARLNKRINRREEAIEALREAIRALAASNDPADSAKASTLRRQLNHAEATRPNLTQRRNDAERELAFLISGQAEHVGLDESF
jgi:chromosome segregation ATPase